MPQRHTPSVEHGRQPRAPRRMSAISGDDRLEAVDIARFAAIVGMMAAHLLLPVGSAWDPGASGWQTAIADTVTPAVNGTSAAAFGVLGGVSMVLASRRMLSTGRRAAAMVSMLTRAVVVMGVGVVLCVLPASPIVVLTYFGFAMMLTAPLLLVRTWVLGGVTALLAAAGPWLNGAVWSWRFGSEPIGSVDRLGANPAGILVDLLFTGAYPAVTWSVYLGVGMLVGRLLSGDRVAPGLLARVMLIGGAGAFCVSSLVSNAVLDHFAAAWAAARGDAAGDLPSLLLFGSGGPLGAEAWWQWTAVPHTGTVLDLVRTVGCAAALIGAMLLVCPPGSPVPRAVEPIRAAGAAPLTIYSAHILVSAITGVVAFLAFLASGETDRSFDVLTEGVPAWLGHVAMALLIGGVLARLGRRGPLEALTTRLARAASRRIRFSRRATPRPSA